MEEGGSRLSKYIGKEARRQLLLREIKKLEDERDLLNQEVLEQENRLQSLNQKSDKLEDEYQTFPSEQSMQEAWDIIYKVRQKIKILGKDVQQKNGVLLKALETWRSLKAQVKELSRTVTLPLDEFSYEKAHIGISSYREGLSTIESKYQQVHSTRRERSAVLSHLENTSEAVDELAAIYFYESFLGCQFSLSDKRWTMDFHDHTKDFIEILTVEDEKKVELQSALHSYLKVSQSNVVDVSAFADEYLTPEQKDSYCEYMEVKEFPSHAVTKDISLIQNKLKKRLITFSSNVSLSAPSDNFNELVEIIGREGTKTTLRIEGFIKGQ